MSYHEPVMPVKCIEGLDIHPDGTYVDVTFGGGGHSGEIIKHLGKKGRLVAFDQDPDAKANAINDERFLLVADNFRNMKHHLAGAGFLPVNGILADLGVSSHQFDTPGRGFSTRFEHSLDMRMSQDAPFTALHILNNYHEKDLVNMFSRYGEVKNSKTLAATIVKTRARHPFTGSRDFNAAIEHLVPAQDASAYLARVYQALRIEVNGELEALTAFLEQASDVLVQGGRLVVISYHSLEDRLVKNYITKGNFDGTDSKDLFGNTLGLKFRPVNRKPYIPASDEIKRNPRSRSAKLRVAEKI